MNAKTKIQHTPGPWKAVGDIVSSTHPDYEHSLIAKIATGENEPEEKANARLISASPELLEAVSEAMEFFDARNLESGDEEAARVAGKLRSALATAPYYS